MRALLAILACLYVFAAGAFCMLAGGVVWGTDSMGLMAFLLAIVGPLLGLFTYNAKSIMAGL